MRRENPAYIISSSNPPDLSFGAWRPVLRHPKNEFICPECVRPFVTTLHESMTINEKAKYEKFNGSVLHIL